MFFRLDPSSALDFLWACSHIPRIWQGRDQKISQVSSQAHIQSISRDQSQREFILLKLMTVCVCVSFYVCAEENWEVCAPAQLGGAHQPGRPDFVRVGAQQPRLTPRWYEQPGPGVLLPHPVQAAPPSLLLQRRSRKHQESLGVSHQLLKEMGGQVRLSFTLILHSRSLSHASICKDTYAHHTSS